MKMTVGLRSCQIRVSSSCKCHAGLRVDAGERLVHQQHVGIVGERADDADALLHAAGQLVRIAIRGMRRGRPAPDIRRAMRSRSAFGTPRIFGPKPTFSSTVFHGKRANDWKTTPRSGPGPLTELAVHQDLDRPYRG